MALLEILVAQCGSKKAAEIFRFSEREKQTERNSKNWAIKFILIWWLNDAG